MGKHTQVKAQNDKGSVSVSQHDSDSPLLPVPQLEHLHQFRPDLVDWVRDQTQIEAEERRKRTTTVDRYIFSERTLGTILGALVALTGLCLAAYLSLTGHEKTAQVLGGGTLVSMVAVLVTGRMTKK